MNKLLTFNFFAALRACLLFRQTGDDDFFGVDKQDIEMSDFIAKMKNSTMQWVERLEANDADGVAAMFCNQRELDGEGLLIGTVSQTLRSRDGVRDYFDYFANIPGIHVKQASMYPSMISNDAGNRIGVNNVFATLGADDDRDQRTRMSYVWKEVGNDICLALLHSSEVPEENRQLRDPSLRLHRQ